MKGGSAVAPRDLIANALKGGFVGGAWAMLGLLRRRTRDSAPELVWRFAAAGAIVFVLRYLFEEVSSRSTAWYYAVWMVTTGFAFSVVSLGRIVSDGSGLWGLFLVFSATALAGGVFGWMYRQWNE